MATAKHRRSRRSAAKSPPRDSSGSERAIYASAALATLAAAAVTFWKGREIYRHLYLHQAPGTTEDLIIIFAAIGAIQIAYWKVLNAPPPFRIRPNAFAAHIILFLSRVSFMLAGALFSIVVLVRLEELNISSRGLMTFIAVLFTIYCFSRWVERIGNAIAKGNPPDEA